MVVGFIFAALAVRLEELLVVVAVEVAHQPVEHGCLHHACAHGGIGVGDLHHLVDGLLVLLKEQWVGTAVGVEEGVHLCVRYPGAQKLVGVVGRGGEGLPVGVGGALVCYVEEGVNIVEVADEQLGLWRRPPVLRAEKVEGCAEGLEILGAQLSLEGVDALRRGGREVLVAHHAKARGREHQVELAQHREESLERHELLERAHHLRVGALLLHVGLAGKAEHCAAKHGHLLADGWHDRLQHALVGACANRQGFLKLILRDCYLHRCWC